MYLVTEHNPFNLSEGVTNKPFEDRLKAVAFIHSREGNDEYSNLEHHLYVADYATNTWAELEF